MYVFPYWCFFRLFPFSFIIVRAPTEDLNTALFQPWDYILGVSSLCLFYSVSLLDIRTCWELKPKVIGKVIARPHCAWCFLQYLCISFIVVPIIKMWKSNLFSFRELPISQIHVIIGGGGEFMIKPRSICVLSLLRRWFLWSFVYLRKKVCSVQGLNLWSKGLIRCAHCMHLVILSYLRYHYRNSFNSWEW